MSISLWVGTNSMCFFFFFQAEDGIRDVAVTGVQTCALPISVRLPATRGTVTLRIFGFAGTVVPVGFTAQIPGTTTRFQTTASGTITNIGGSRSEEHTSELQSRLHLVCRLLLEKKK